jgi:hypothetical protein
LHLHPFLSSTSNTNNTFNIMDDWQDAVFSSRHMHNRVNRNGNNSTGRSKHNQAFDVRRTFGTYACRCAAWQRMASSMDDYDSEKEIVLELYRLTDNRQGVIGEIRFPGILDAAVILAASRGSLRRTVQEAGEEDTESDDVSEPANSDDEGVDDDEEESEQETDRFDTFEKNSFREPKFWLRWNGTLTPGATGRESESRESDLGYIVFSQNDCRKFKGTMNCSSLGWKDVAISGRQISGRTESDVPVDWGRIEGEKSEALVG